MTLFARVRAISPLRDAHLTDCYYCNNYFYQSLLDVHIEGGDSNNTKIIFVSRRILVLDVRGQPYTHTRQTHVFLKSLSQTRIHSVYIPPL